LQGFGSEAVEIVFYTFYLLMLRGKGCAVLAARGAARTLA
jgi:hypothetical protein